MWQESSGSRDRGPQSLRHLPPLKDLETWATASSLHGPHPAWSCRGALLVQACKAVEERRLVLTQRPLRGVHHWADEPPDAAERFVVADRRARLPGPCVE